MSRPANAPTATAGTAEFAAEPSADECFGFGLGRGAVVAGRYTLVDVVGSGGMGEVWVAQQTEPVARRVALKLIRAGMDSRPVLARFERERQALALMDHPNIARVYDGGATPAGQPFFVMEMVDGSPLTHFCDAAKLSPRERLELFVPICRAVQHAHQKGIVHRDLKPANVLVTVIDGKPMPKVIDFGVAKATAGRPTEASLATQIGAVIGTLEYMAPEQAAAAGDDIDTRADVYALGVILYELLTGLRPHDGARLRQAAFDEVVRIIREEEPAKPSTRLSASEARPSLASVRQTEPKRLAKLLRGDLDWVVMKCLEKRRDRRYETASGLARDVERYLADEPVEARPPSVGYRFGKFLRRHKGPAVAAVLVAAALVAGTAGTAWGMVRAKESAAVADEKRAQAEASLAHAKAGNAILGSVFAGLDPTAAYATVAELRNALRDNLDRAAKALDGTAVGDPLEVAALQSTLGLSLLGLGEGAAAAGVCAKVVRTRTDRLGPDHAATLAATNDLAEAYRFAGRLDAALPLLEAALSRMRAALGPDHATTLAAANNLALGYKLVGRADKSLPLYESAYELHRARHGTDHPDSLTFANNLGLAYQAANRLDRALPLLADTLARRRAALGSDHHYTLSSLGNLASCYRASGRLDEARPLYEESLWGMTAKLGGDHPDTLLAASNLALLYRDLRLFDRALPLYRDTLERRRVRLGPDHPETAMSTALLAEATHSAGRPAEALPLFEAAAVGFERNGFRHEHAAKELFLVANALEEAGEFGRAEHWRRACLAIARDKGAAGDSELALLGDNLRKQGRWADAEAAFRECLAVREATRPDAWNTFNARSLLGAALLGQRKYAEAEPLLLGGYEGLAARAAKIPAVVKRRIGDALGRLVELYDATDRPAEAAKFRAMRADAK